MSHQYMKPVILILDTLFQKHKDFIIKYDIQEYFDNKEFYFLLKDGLNIIHIVHAEDFDQGKHLFSNILYKIYNITYNEFQIYKEYYIHIHSKKQTNAYT